MAVCWLEAWRLPRRALCRRQLLAGALPALSNAHRRVDIPSSGIQIRQRVFEKIKEKKSKILKESVMMWTRAWDCGTVTRTLSNGNQTLLTFLTAPRPCAPEVSSPAQYPPSPAAAAATSSSGISVTTTSDVRKVLDTEAAFSSAHLITLVGSMIPFSMRSWYSPTAALKP